MKLLKTILIGFFVSLGVASPVVAAIGSQTVENLYDGRVKVTIDRHGWHLKHGESKPYKFCYKRVSRQNNIVCERSSSATHVFDIKFDHGERVDFLAQCRCQYNTLFGHTHIWRNIRNADLTVQVIENGTPVLSTSITETFPKNSRYGQMNLPKICQSEIMEYQIGYPNYASGQYIGLSRFNLMTWTDIVEHHSGWISESTPSSPELTVNDFLKPENQGKFKPFQTYKVAYAVGPTWKITHEFFYVAPCGGTTPGPLEEIAAEVKESKLLKPL